MGKDKVSTEDPGRKIAKADEGKGVRKDMVMERWIKQNPRNVCLHLDPANDICVNTWFIGILFEEISFLRPEAYGDKRFIANHVINCLTHTPLPQEYQQKGYKILEMLGNEFVELYKTDRDQLVSV